MPGEPTVSYAYDALDRRAGRADGTTSETYAYVGTGVTIGRIDRGGGQLLDSAIDAMGDRLTVGGAWIVPNARGDVAALLDPGAATVSDAYRYDPFGLTLASLGSSANPYRFGGRLLEPTSGQYDFGARQYDPALAAFTSLDTVLGAAADPLSLNRYLYALANPESMIDPDGHAACRLGGEDCAELASKLDGLRSAAAAADAAASATFRLAERADAAADAAVARALEPCRYGDDDICDAWRQSRQATANAAKRAARTAWDNYAAARDRATAAHRALAQALAAQAAVKKRSGQAAPKPKKPKPAPSPWAGARAGVDFVDLSISAAKGLRARASTAARSLRTGATPAIRSAAARVLPELGAETRFVASGVFRGAAKVLPGVGFAVGVADNLGQGQEPPEAFVRAAVDTGAGMGGAAAGIGICGGLGLTTAGIAAAPCVGVVVVASIGFTVVADTVLDVAADAAAAVLDFVTFWDNN